MAIEILTGDCRDVLKAFPEKSFHTCVTSPPYFGLRDYGTAEWEGGDAGCDHIYDTAHQKHGHNSVLKGRSVLEAQKNENLRDTCRKCGARRIDLQMGLEPTPDEYVAALVEVFREVRRVLRDDGTVWLNLGDSYAAGGKGGGGSYMAERKDAAWQSRSKVNGWRSPPPGLKPKDLIGIPWRVAFALQADGWYLRQDIIWSKPNPMPESVTDRCTKAHEYLFLLSKRPRYYFDAMAIREAAEYGRREQPKDTWDRCKIRPERVKGSTKGSDPDAGRNRRSVWTIPTHAFSAAHFATFPPKLIEPCILAGCPKGGNVLDPFGGAGTTGLVADRLQRNATLIELNPEYAEMARRRIEDDAPLLVGMNETSPDPKAEA